LIVADLDVESVFRARRLDPHQRKEIILAEQKQWRQTRIIISEKPFNDHNNKLKQQKPNVLELPDEIYQALVLGTRDYVLKNGFTKVTLGGAEGLIGRTFKYSFQITI
jgi:NAD+ synthase (glutamine-hydrolysing)